MLSQIEACSLPLLWGLFYRMEYFLNQLAAWLAGIIAEIVFYQWNLQENGIG